MAPRKIAFPRANKLHFKHCFVPTPYKYLRVKIKINLDMGQSKHDQGSGHWDFFGMFFYKKIQ